MGIQQAEQALLTAARAYATACEMFPGDNNESLRERFAARLRVAAANYAVAVA